MRGNSGQEASEHVLSARVMHNQQCVQRPTTTTVSDDVISTWFDKIYNPNHARKLFDRFVDVHRKHQALLKAHVELRRLAPYRPLPFMLPLGDGAPDNDPFRSLLNYSDELPGLDIRLVIPMDIFKVPEKRRALVIAAATGDNEHNKSGQTKNRIILASYAVVASGAIALYMDGEVLRADGEWILVDCRVSESALAYASYLVAENETVICGLIGVIYATKISFWESGHHCPDRYSLGMVTKAWTFSFGHKKIKPEFVHAIGHWASTLCVLNSLNVNVRQFAPLFPKHTKFKIPEQLEVRIDLVPAGCRKISWCCTVFDLMLESDIKTTLPVQSLNAHIKCKELLNRILENPVAYHINAKYLAGKHRIYVDENMAPGGLCIPWVTANMPNSTLARSLYYQANAASEYKRLLGYSHIHGMILNFFSKPPEEKILKRKTVWLLNKSFYEPDVIPKYINIVECISISRRRKTI